MTQTTSSSTRERRHFAAAGLHFAWNGGHTVNVFDGEHNVDVFSVGDFALNSATEAEVRTGINAYVKHNGLEATGEEPVDLTQLSDEALARRRRIAYEQSDAWFRAMFQTAPSEYECDHREEAWFWWGPRCFAATFETTARRVAARKASQDAA